MAGFAVTTEDKRVNDAFLSAKSSAEATRKAIAHSLRSSFAGTIGGRQRDHVVLV